MSGRARAATAAPLAGVLAALAFASATAAPWVERPLTRSVGNAAVAEVEVTSGMELVPLAVVAGLAGVLCGVGMLATRGAARRVVALLGVVAGAAAIGAATLGVVRALARDGGLTVAPWIAAAAAVVVAAAGVLGMRAPSPRLPARYDVGVDPADREWRLAADPADAAQHDESAG